MREAIDGDDIPVARDASRTLLAPIRLHPQGDHLAAELQAGELAMAVCGVVAGAGFGTCLLSLARSPRRSS
jgi:hypothetical protein